MVIPIRDDNPTSRFPILTVLLIAANILIYAFIQPHGVQAEVQFDYQHAAIPCELTLVGFAFSIVRSRVGRESADDSASWHGVRREPHLAAPVRPAHARWTRADGALGTVG